MPLRERESPGEGTVLDPFQISPLAFFASISPVTLFFDLFPSQPALQPIAFLFLSCCDLSIPAKYFDWSWIRTIHGTRLELGLPCASSLQETFLSPTLKSALVALGGHAAHFILGIRISIASLWKALSQTETLLNP